MAVEAKGVTMNKLIIGLLIAVALVGALSLWRGGGDDKTQPHIPTEGNRARVP